MKEKYLYYNEGEYFELDLEDELANLYIEGRDELPHCVGTFKTEEEKEELIKKHNQLIQRL